MREKMPTEPPESNFTSFIKSRYAMPIGIVLTLILSFFLLWGEKSGALCMAPLLIAIAGYLIPKNFGLKDIRWIMLWGAVLVLTVSAMATAFTVSYYDNGGYGKVSSSDGGLIDGTVAPYSISDNGTYIYEVTVMPGCDNVKVIVSEVNMVYLESRSGTVLDSYLLENTSTERSGGWIWSAEIPLENGSNYIFYFEGVKDGEEIRTAVGDGPLTMEQYDAWLFYFGQNFINIFTWVGIPFFLLALVSWWIRRNLDRVITEMEEAGRIPPRDGRPCIQCGTALSKDAEVCPGCGRIIPKYIPPQQLTEEEEGDKLVCSECGAEVEADAEFCPNCGEGFEE